MFGCGPVRIFTVNEVGVFAATPILEDGGGKRLCMAEGLPQVPKEVSAQSYFLLCSPAKLGFLEVLASYQIIFVY